MVGRVLVADGEARVREPRPRRRRGVGGEALVRAEVLRGGEEAARAPEGLRAPKLGERSEEDARCPCGSASARALCQSPAADASGIPCAICALAPPRSSQPTWVAVESGRGSSPRSWLIASQPKSASSSPVIIRASAKANGQRARSAAPRRTRREHRLRPRRRQLPQPGGALHPERRRRVALCWHSTAAPRRPARAPAPTRAGACTNEESPGVARSVPADGTTSTKLGRLLAPGCDRNIKRARARAARVDDDAEERNGGGHRPGRVLYSTLRFLRSSSAGARLGARRAAAAAAGARHRRGARGGRWGRARQEGRGVREVVDVNSCAWAPQLGRPYRCTMVPPKYGTIIRVHATRRRHAGDVAVDSPRRWLSAALLAFSAALLALSAAAFRGPPSPSFRQRRRVDAPTGRSSAASPPARPAPASRSPPSRRPLRTSRRRICASLAGTSCAQR